MTNDQELNEYEYTDRFLDAARRPEELVSRVNEIGLLEKAVCQPRDGGLHIVFVYGQGGMGKSRLTEEALRRAGNREMRSEKRLGPIPPDHPEWDWTRKANLIVPDLLDMTQTSYHFAQRFMRTLREHLRKAQPGLDFKDYDEAYRDYQQRVTWGVGNQILEEAAKYAEQTFFTCYRKAASQGARIVLTLDTCEKLAYTYTDWLVKEKLLKRAEIPFISHWLVNRIQAGDFPNTTLILVGRDDDRGRNFFDLVRDAVGEKQPQLAVDLDEIQLSGFDRDEVCAYFQSLAKFWDQAARSDPRCKYTANDFNTLAADERLLTQLWRYTGGQPVRLALYSDLIVEGRGLSEHLFDNPAQGAPAPPDPQAVAEAKENLLQVQADIERSFIYLLFSQGGLRAEIMTTLARAPRGLTAEQLCTILFNVPLDQKPDDNHLEQIRRELDGLRKLAIIKIRPEDRIGLQDEVYKIYARVAAATEASKANESKARNELYKRLEKYAVRRRSEKRDQRRSFFAEDERKLDLSDPAKANGLILREPSGREQELRNRIQDEIDLWDKEALHYSLLVDLSAALNIVVFELGYKNSKAFSPDDFSDMEEVYQVLYDEDLVQFIHLYRSASMEARGEKPIDVLRRFMRQAEAARWLSRFVILWETKRVKEFAADVEAYILRLEGVERASWQHTLSESERQCWLQYMRVLEGEEIRDALKQLETVARDLEELSQKTSDELVQPEGGEEEYGFIGHPGLERVKRVLALVYNSMGYGYVTVGDLRTSMKYYSKALAQMRTTEARVQMATILNNLSRVLSDMGRHRARRVCLDALELRREEGALVPLAYSLNTLALIDNDQIRPDLAWPEAAMAAAYFRKTGERRGLGLALIQMGEALRRLAGDEKILGRALPSDPEEIYDAAEQALDEAVRIFTSGKQKNEEIRLVEAQIELGCLLRDRLRRIADPEFKTMTYESALNNLAAAAATARKYGITRLELDAEVNQAWANYAFRDFAKAEEALHRAENLIPKNGFITTEYLPGPARNDSYVFQQLSKIYGLRGRIAMDRFTRRCSEIEEENANKTRQERHDLIESDAAAQEHLKQAAHYYILALAYGQLFSPRSGALSAIYNALYGYLKSFNDRELKRFYAYQEAERKKYRMSELKMEDLGDLGEFLRECIGDF